MNYRKNQQTKKYTNCKILKNFVKIYKNLPILVDINLILFETYNQIMILQNN